VSFAKGNVLDTGLCAARSFDVVLCRNLLIYLDPAARARALDNLCSWLVDDGLLFAGHAEAVEQMDARFQRLAESSPFAYVKQSRGRVDAARNQADGRGAAGARPVTSSRALARPTTGPRPIIAKGTPAAAVRARSCAQSWPRSQARPTPSHCCASSASCVCPLAHAGRIDKLTARSDGPGSKPRKRVLVVDDSITVREVERQLLVNRGYEVDVAVDGIDGLNSIRSSRYDLVVSDIDMPRLSGLELVRAIKQDPKLGATPIIIVSYKDREEDRMRGLDAGANYYLTKSSFHDETLVRAVEDLVGSADG
jgi:CheY-like chemotaxis protein